MYIVTFTAHQQRNMVRTPHFFGAGDATAMHHCASFERADVKRRKAQLATKLYYNYTQLYVVPCISEVLW